MLRRNFLAAGVAAPFLAGQARAAGADIPIGAIEILSGPAAAYGIAIRAGLELALGDVNAKGVLGGRKLKLTVLDSAGDKNQAINAARELIGRDNVISIIGPTLSTEMFAVGPVTNARKIPIIGTSTTAVGITDIGPYVFRTSLPEADVVPATLRYAMDHGVKTIAFLYANDDVFAKSSYDVMLAAAKKAGLKILDSEAFGTHDTDFSAQLTKVKALKPDAVAVTALVEPTAGVMLQARALGFDSKTMFLGGNGANSPKLGQIAGKAADGLIVGSPWFIGKNDPLNDVFIAAFRKKYDRDPDQFAAQAFDTLKILAAAIDRAGAPDPTKVRDALLKTDFTGVMGPFTFTPHRDPASAKGVVVLQMEGGQFRIAP